MSTSTTSFYPIDPELPLRPPFELVSHDGHGEQETSDYALADLIQAVNSTTTPRETPTPESNTGKRRYDDEFCLSTPKRSRVDNSISISQASGQQYSPEYAPSARSESADRASADPSLALFRKSTGPPAKKYTRPPTKKVFRSLKLTPEEWVRLEGEAKAYMLNTKFPERQACVGNRNNGPTNDTKINLFKTVQKFLEDDIGERFFGAALDEKEEGKRWVYPRDETQLIGYLTPLMRRMVTNERQRQYARRTRQNGATIQTSEQEQVPYNGVHHEQSAEREMSLQNSLGSPTFPQHITSAPPSPQQRSILVENCIECVILVDNVVAFRYIISDSSISYADLHNQIEDHISHHEQNKVSTMSSTFSLTHADIIGRGTEHAAVEAQKVAMAAEAHALENNSNELTVEVHGPEGLRKVSGEEGWRNIKAAIRSAVWMLGFIRVVVKVGSSTDTNDERVVV